MIIFVLTILPASADTRFETMEDLINYINASAELLSYMDYSTNTKIDIKNCSFQIVTNDIGSYSCIVNQSTDIYVYTDKYLKPTMVVITGPIDKNGNVKMTTYDWAMAALFALAQPDNLYIDDLYNMYLESLTSGFYEDNYNSVICSTDDNTNLWHYIINNK